MLVSVFVLLSLPIKTVLKQSYPSEYVNMCQAAIDMIDPLVNS